MNEEHFIEVIITNENGSTAILDTNPMGETIHEYMDVIARALHGLSFHPNTIEDGFAAYLEERGWSVEKEER